MQIIHICKDEKFIDMAVKIYDDLEFFESKYICYAKTNETKYIKNSKDRMLVMNDWKNIVSYVNDSGVSVVVLHSLFQPYYFFKNLKSSIKVVWHIFGTDTYGDKALFADKRHINIELYKPETRKFVYNNFRELKSRIRRFLTCNREYRQYKKSVERVDYISTILKNEQQLMHAKNCKGFLSFNYYDKDDDVLQISKEAFNVVIGNSLAVTNNHTDILKLIKDRNLKIKGDIILPISYPAEKELYKDFLKRKIDEYKIRVKCLESFMPIKVYEKILESCGFAIYGFTRQQATENISMLLRMGVKIFFYRECIVYQYLKNMGYYVYTIEDDLNSDSLSEQLTKEQKETNRILCEKERDYDSFIGQLKKEYSDIVKA